MGERIVGIAAVEADHRKTAGIADHGQRAGAVKHFGIVGAEHDDIVARPAIDHVAGARVQAAPIRLRLGIGRHRLERNAAGLAAIERRHEIVELRGRRRAAEQALEDAGDELGVGLGAVAGLPLGAGHKCRGNVGQAFRAVVESGHPALEAAEIPLPPEAAIVEPFDIGCIGRGPGIDIARLGVGARPRAAIDHVVALSGMDHRAARPGLDQVITRAAGQRIRRGTADDDVVA